MLDKLTVPEINVDDYFDDLSIQIKEKGITDEDVFSVVKETWRFINKLQVNCLKMQRNSIQLLTLELEASQKEFNELKEFMDDHPEIGLMKRMIERNKDRK